MLHLLDPQHQLEWSYEIGSVSLSILLSLSLSGSFLGIVSLVFSKFWHGARNLHEVVHNRARFLEKKNFCPQDWENGPRMGQNMVFFNFLKNLIINVCWICSKIYIMCSVPAQIPYLVKVLFMRYGAKCSQPMRLQDFLIFNQPYLQNKSVKQPDFMHVDTNSHKLKANQTYFGWVQSKMGVTSLVMGL